MRLEVEGVNKSYGATTALCDVDLAAGEGEVVGLLGPNGAGKTTLVSLVCGLRRPDAGRIRVEGHDVVAASDAVRHLVAVAGQETAVYPPLTVRENIELFGRVGGVPRHDLAHRCDVAIEQLRLAHLERRQVRHLSLGEVRRVHTAAALVAPRPLLLLDEPTAGVDPETRNAILELVRSLAADGSTVVYSTHYLGEVESLSADVVILDRGRVVARGDARELVACYGRSFVELAFDGPAPALGMDETDVGGNRLRVPADDPAATAAQALDAVGRTGGARLVGVEIVNSSLESVFLALTGRRVDDDQPAPDDPAQPA